MGDLLMGTVWQPGDGITAAKLSVTTDGITANRPSLDPSNDLASVGAPGGLGLRDDSAAPILGVLTGTASPYSFVSRVDLGGAAIGNGARSGTAHEVNHVGLLGGKTVRLYPDRSGKYRFQYVGHGTGSGSGGGGLEHLPECFCDPVPSPLTMTSYSTTCNYGMFQSCTLVYGPLSPGYASLGLPFTSAFVSTESFPDIISGALFQYLLTCQYNEFDLTRIFLTSPYGSPAQDGLLYSWLVGGYGNTCVPFHLDNGLPYAGSDASCVVTIDF